MGKIAFHCYANFEKSILKPVYDLLKEDFFCLFTRSVGEVIKFKPKVLILANHHYHYFRGNLKDTIIVWTRHGFATKNSINKAIAGADFACVSSNWVKEEFIHRGWKPRLDFWVTGFISMDKIFSRKKELPSILPPGFPWGKKTVLYAPTWNKYFTSVELLRPKVIEKIFNHFPQLNLIIKPHPQLTQTYPGIIKQWRQYKDERVILVENFEDDIYPFFPFADLLITDASSVMFYFLAMDRPIILINNPKRFQEKEYYDPSAPEWTWRDMGIEVESLSGLIAAIEIALLYPQEKAERRAFYRELVFGDLTDGRASERIAEKVRTLLKPDEINREWVKICWDKVKVMSAEDKGWRHWKVRSFLAKIGKFFNRFPVIKYFLKKVIRW